MQPQACSAPTERHYGAAARRATTTKLLGSSSNRRHTTPCANSTSAEQGVQTRPNPTPPESIQESTVDVTDQLTHPIRQQDTILTQSSQVANGSINLAETAGDLGNVEIPVENFVTFDSDLVARCGIGKHSIQSPRNSSYFWATLTGGAPLAGFPAQKTPRYPAASKRLAYRPVAVSEVEHQPSCGRRTRRGRRSPTIVRSNDASIVPWRGDIVAYMSALAGRPLDAQTALAAFKKLNAAGLGNVANEAAQSAQRATEQGAAQSTQRSGCACAGSPPTRSTARRSRSTYCSSTSMRNSRQREA